MSGIRSLGHTPEFSTNFGGDPTQNTKPLLPLCCRHTQDQEHLCYRSLGLLGSSHEINAPRILIMFQWYWCGNLGRNHLQEALRHLRWHQLVDMYTASSFHDWEVTCCVSYSILWNSFRCDSSPRIIALFRGKVWVLLGRYPSSCSFVITLPIWCVSPHVVSVFGVLS